jgi:CheY-like chemotaxis protein
MREKELKLTIKVLVLDRTHDTEKLAKALLTPLGCQIITASSTALGVFLARKNFPCLVIAGLKDPSDYQDLPDAIKDDPDLAHIPIVMFSPQDQRAKTPGADKYLSMPIAEEQFIAEITPYLKQSIDERPEETSE